MIMNKKEIQILTARGPRRQHRTSAAAAMKLIIALLSVAGTSAFTPLRSPSSLRARAITRMSEEPAAEPVAETVTEEPAAPSSEGR